MIAMQKDMLIFNHAYNPAPPHIHTEIVPDSNPAPLSAHVSPPLSHMHLNRHESRVSKPAPLDLQQLRDNRMMEHLQPPYAHMQVHKEGHTLSPDAARMYALLHKLGHMHAHINTELRTHTCFDQAGDRLFPHVALLVRHTIHLHDPVVDPDLSACTDTRQTFRHHHVSTPHNHQKHSGNLLQATVRRHTYTRTPHTQTFNVL